MASYRVYYCGYDGKIFSADDFVAMDDSGAIRRASSLVKGNAPIFEVWHRDRLVCRQPHAAQTSGDKPERLDWQTSA